MTRDHGSSRDDPDDPLVRLRALCTALPEVTERPSHGEPTWFVRDKKAFVMYADHHHDDRLGFWAAAPEGVQQLLVGAEPDSFFRPPYVGHRGWLGVYLDVDVDWDRVAEIVTDAYRRIAPKRLVAELGRTGAQEPEVGTQ
ncbi:MmcQ/YjbR family DNA-binding protein [Actinopolymorpha sp. NPDC004070]|uniref:MmcQ/YjbR family DNA-binding protein n=1 Tax=Actinopolymorpha sp. NPDC004070 TaxID=3154548 RepID=UPI0033ACFBAE